MTGSARFLHPPTLETSRRGVPARSAPYRRRTVAETTWTADDRIVTRECPRPREHSMTNRPRPRLSLSLNGLTARQLAAETWRRMEGHDAMIWAAAIAF